MTESSKDVDFCDAFHAEVPLPEWAVGHADGQYVLGAQLPTRDGRRMGNAHIISTLSPANQCEAEFNQFTILTDAGTEMVMNGRELAECFYPPQYVSDVKEVLRKFSLHD